MFVCCYARHAIRNSIGDRGVELLAQALLKNSSVEMLSLGGNRLTDEAAKSLARFLRSGRSSLKALNLAGVTPKRLRCGGITEIGILRVASFEKNYTFPLPLGFLFVRLLLSPLLCPTLTLFLTVRHFTVEGERLMFLLTDENKTSRAVA